MSLTPIFWATVERWADQIGLHYKPDGSGGIISTIEAFNAALGITAAAASDGKYDDINFG